VLAKKEKGRKDFEKEGLEEGLRRKDWEDVQAKILIPDINSN
jgi:hypothetical protein